MVPLVQLKVHTRAGEPEPGVFGTLEPEPIEKKQEQEPLGKIPGAGAARGKNREPVKFDCFMSFDY